MPYLNMAARKSTKKSFSPLSNAPINLPSIIILLIILLGLAILVGIVQVPAIFRSKASNDAIRFSGQGVTQNGDTYTTTTPTVQVTLTSPLQASASDPTTNAQPIFTDNMDNPDAKLLGNTNDTQRVGNYNWYQTYQNGTYEILIVPGDNTNDRNTNAFYIGSVYHKDVESEFTAIFDSKLTGEGQGERGFGLTFGSQKEFCDFGSRDCYSVELSNDKNLRIYYHDPKITPGAVLSPIVKQNINFDFKEGTWYTYRVDRKLDHLKVWARSQKGGGWQQIVDTSLDSNNGRGRKIGFVVTKYNSNYGISVRGNFDNLKVYKLGDLPEPGNDLAFRYSQDSASINSDPNGEKIKWQAMTSNPINISQTFSPEAGTKYFFVQFKNGNQVSQIYQNTITLGSASDAQTNNAPQTENNQSYAACGKSGYLASGYSAITSCPTGTYLVVDQYGDRLEPSCRAVPPGTVRDASDICKVVANQQTTTGNVCLSNQGYACGDANGKTRTGKTCQNYQASLNAGCSSDNVYPYCFSACN